MKLTIVGSSSAGNSYILDSGNGVLLVECGVRFDKIKKALGYQISNVVGCIVTHGHKDHCVSAEDVLSAGINIYASAGTIQEMGITHHRLRTIKAHQPFDVVHFRIYPFDVKHDTLEPLCFLIKHQDSGNTLYLSDSFYCPYKFEGLNNILVEANYCQKIIDAKLKEQGMGFLRDRVLQSHMSIDTCKEFLKANDLSQVNNIVLIHLSDANSDAARFKKEVRELTGKSVYVAEPGLVIEQFNKQPF